MTQTLGCICLASPGCNGLERCLKSLGGCVDRMYVGTQCPEAHRDVIDRHGAVAVPISWADRFDDALNEIMAHVKEDWTLRMDDDMWLEPASGPDLRALIDVPIANTCSLLAVDHLDGHRTRFSYMVRLWRTGSVRYAGRVHERLVDGDTGAVLGKSPRVHLPLHHDGYKGADFEAKRSRNMSALMQDLEDNPNDVYLKCYVLLTETDDEFARHLRETARWLSHILARPEEPPTQKVSQVAVRVLEAAATRGGSLEVSGLADLVEQRYWNKPRVTWALLVHHQSIGKTRKFIECLRAMLGAATVPLIDFSEWLDPRILGSRLYEMAAAYSASSANLLEAARNQYLVDPPYASPLFTTCEVKDWLWVDQTVYLHLGKAVSELGFRPDSYGRDKAISLVAVDNGDPDEAEWWTRASGLYLPGGLPLDARQAKLMASLLESWAVALPDAPVEFVDAAHKPGFSVFMTASHLRQCARELAQWLRKGAVLIVWRTAFRYVEVRIV